MKGILSTLTLLCLLSTGVNAVDVAIPQQLYEVARGDNISVPCTFKTTVSNKLVLIQWSNMADTPDADEIYIITYYPADGTSDVAPEYTGRASLDADLLTGRFNLKVSSVTLLDNKKYKCHVQAAGDSSKSYATTRVQVLVAPSTPECNIQGKAEYGQNVNLTCLSREGSPPPSYTWESRDVQNNPRPMDPKTTSNGGILSLFNISKDTSGYFICTSANKIRSAKCNLTLSVMPPSMNIGATAGIVAGVAIFLLVLGIIVYCCCCRKKKDKEEDYAMGVHEDEYHDKDLAKKGDGHYADRQEEVRVSENANVKSANSAADRRDEYEERSERSYDRRKDLDDRRSDYDDRRSDYDDRRSDYDDRRSDYDDRRRDYDDRRDDNRRYDDDRRYNDRRDRCYDDDRYDDRNRDRPSVPSNKPPKKN